MKFIDLFAGLGGFHVGLNRLGFECVFACEKKTELADLYAQNFKLQPHGDISDVDISSIPQHDILCAGFPCQPFSKAGRQAGLRDEHNGGLFDVICDILEYHRPQYFILENVRNLERHDKGRTRQYIFDRLECDLEYHIDSAILSPHHFGIPHHRERLFIIGSLKELENFQWPRKRELKRSITDFINANQANGNRLEFQKIRALQLWQEFFDALPENAELPTWPIWSMEYGASYPFETCTPFNSTNYSLGRRNGSFGKSLAGLTRTEKMANIPSYARQEVDTFPSWKINFIYKNREFFTTYQKELKRIIPKIRSLETPSWQKFEWNIKGGDKHIRNYLVQFRGSGIRVKKPDYFPSLVTVKTQVPVIAWQERYISPKEAARLHSLGNIRLPETSAAAFHALGNAVSADLVYRIARNLVSPNKSSLL